MAVVRRDRYEYGEAGVGKLGGRTSTVLVVVAALLVAQEETVAAPSTAACWEDGGATFLVACGTSPTSRFLFLGGGA